LFLTVRLHNFLSDVLSTGVPVIYMGIVGMNFFLRQAGYVLLLEIYVHAGRTKKKRWSITAPTLL